jgi:hypothetical protein
MTRRETSVQPDAVGGRCEAPATGFSGCGSLVTGGDNSSVLVRERG